MEWKGVVRRSRVMLWTLQDRLMILCCGRPGGVKPSRNGQRKEGE